MRTTGEIERVPMKYGQRVYVRKKHREYLWEYKEKAPLEKYILRIFTYGNFHDLKYIIGKYPKECLDIIERYKVHRGVRYWVRELANRKTN